MDEHLYRMLKQVEASTQACVFALPQKESLGYGALRIPYSEEWKMGALIDHLIWLQKVAAKAATNEYMKGKE